MPLGLCQIRSCSMQWVWKTYALTMLTRWMACSGMEYTVASRLVYPNPVRMSLLNCETMVSNQRNKG